MSLKVADASMSTEPAEPTPLEPAPPPDDRQPAASGARQSIVTRRRVIAMLVYAALIAALVAFTGLPTDPIKIFLCLWAGVIAWNIDRPWRSHLGFARDWITPVVLLVIYNFSRGYADNGVTPHVTEMIDADAWMFGRLTDGQIPTVWLQQHLYDPEHAHWYDVAASFVYFSHFLAALVVAAVLWMRNRGAWGVFTRRWFTLCALGLATYFLYPAAPPWWAAQHQYIAPVIHGVASRGWYAIGMRHGGNLLNAAQLDAANQIAAMPSLHSAFSMLIAVFFMTRARKRWWPLLLCYPLAMAFTLVYGGEHYVTDVLIGWAYVGVTYGLVIGAERWWARRSVRAEAEAARLELAERPSAVQPPAATGPLMPVEPVEPPRSEPE